MNPAEQPEDRSDIIFDSSDSTLLIITGPGDTTVRPRRPNVPRPGEEPRPQPRGTPPQPPKDEPPAQA